MQATFNTSPVTAAFLIGNASPDFPGEQEPVDLSRMRAMVGDEPEDIRSLASLYLGEAEKGFARLEAAVGSGSEEEVEQVAHKLGGTSAMCGMMGIVAPLRAMELSGRSGLGPNDEALLAEAGRQKNRISAYLHSHVLQGAA